MLLKSEKSPALPAKKLQLKFGESFKRYARENRLVIIYGIEKSWVHEMFLTDPSLRSLWFQLQWFCNKSDIEEIESDYVQLIKAGEGPLYSNQFYQVDPLVNYEGTGGYLDLLDSIANTLEEKNYQVKRIIFECSTFKTLRDVGFEPFYAKPKTIELFRSLDTGSFVELDSTDESLITLPFRKQNHEFNT